MKAERAIFILSLDTEAAWGMFDTPGGLQRYKTQFDAWRKHAGVLAELLERYQVKATWDFVGHLFLSECAPVQGVLHPEVRMPAYQDKRKDWRLVADPGTNVVRDPWWYGRDVMERVRDMKPRQEIATHTFSHMTMDRPECTEEVARSEMRVCMNLAKQEGIVLDSMVFPFNRVAHLAVAREFGIKAFRGVERRWYLSSSAALQKPCIFFEKIFLSTPPVYPLRSLRYVDGVLEIPASMFLLNYDGILKKAIPSSWRYLQAKRGMERAIKSRAIFHLWLHPFNMGSSRHMIENMEDILRFARNAIDGGAMINATMRETRILYETFNNGATT